MDGQRRAKCPACKATKPLPEALRLRLAGVPDLFDMFTTGEPTQ
jgi:hypothetical protein